MNGRALRWLSRWSRPPIGEAKGECDAEPSGRRGRGERGSAIITASVLIFTLTAGGILYLSRDVNRVVTNRSAAQSIAFQSARAGAQQVDVDSLRGGGQVLINGPAAAEESSRVGHLLLDAYGLDGTVSPPEIAGDTVTISVTVIDRYGTQTALASVQAQTGP